MTPVGSIIVRTPSWGPQTFHLGPLSVHELHLDDARRLGREALTLAELFRALAEGRMLAIGGAVTGVTYRVELLCR